MTRQLLFLILGASLFLGCDVDHEGPPIDGGEDGVADMSTDLPLEDTSPADMAVDADPCEGVTCETGFECVEGVCQALAECDDNSECEGELHVCTDGRCVCDAAPLCDGSALVTCEGREECTGECVTTSEGAQCCIPGCVGDQYQFCGENPSLVPCMACREEEGGAQCWSASTVDAWPTSEPTTLGAILSGGVIDTAAGAAHCDASVADYCVVHLASLEVNDPITVQGARPLILLVDGDVTINAAITVVASGAGARSIAGADAANARTGGGGGALCGSGGNGGRSSRDHSTLGGGGGTAASVTPPALQIGGSGGAGWAGTGDTAASGGLGGGAIQISARGSITLDNTITARGTGGLDGNGSTTINRGGGGGGSGGYILLETPTTFTSPPAASSNILLVQGGQGGNGGGSGAPGEGGARGPNSGGANMDGLPGGDTTATSNSGGGGGGGAGCVVVPDGAGLESRVLGAYSERTHWTAPTAP